MFATDSGSHYGCEGECSVNGYHVLTAQAGINRIHNKYGKYLCKRLYDQLRNNIWQRMASQVPSAVQYD